MTALEVVEHDATDLFGLTAALVAVPSESHHEEELAKIVAERLRARAPSLALHEIGNNVVARTTLGRERRVVLGGHLDTVPANGNDVPRLDGDVLHGLGSADMDLDGRDSHSIQYQNANNSVRVTDDFMGFVGGFLPAARAARMKIVDALRAA